MRFIVIFENGLSTVVEADDFDSVTSKLPVCVQSLSFSYNGEKEKVIAIIKQEDYDKVRTFFTD